MAKEESTCIHEQLMNHISLNKKARVDVMVSHTQHRTHFGQCIPGCMTQYTSNNIEAESEGSTQFRIKELEG